MKATLHEIKMEALAGSIMDYVKLNPSKKELKEYILIMTDEFFRTCVNRKEDIIDILNDHLAPIKLMNKIIKRS